MPPPTVPSFVAAVVDGTMPKQAPSAPVPWSIVRSKATLSEAKEFVPAAGIVAPKGAVGAVVAEIVSGALPVLDTVTDDDAVWPTATLPNATAVGVTASTGAGAGVPVPDRGTVWVPPLVVKASDPLE